MPDIIPHLNAALEGRYRIERELGEGGMATVFLAEDLRHQRSVALKVLKPELARAVGDERFLAEIRNTANLRHPHILPLFDSGHADGFLYYVMPHVEGESLRDLLDREERLPVGEAVRIAIAVTNALQHAHDRGVVHRDIKPANILLQDREPIVADFGIAVALGASEGGRLTATGIAVGTVAYMSPEQATGSRDVDGRTDLYAVGCVLHEMLTGEVPFAGLSPQAVLARKVVGDFSGTARGIEGVPATLADVVEKALASEPEKRFQTAGELTQALSKALDEEAIHERGVTERRRRALRGSGVVAVLAALTLGIRWIGGAMSGPTIERLAVLPPTNLAGAADQEPLMEGMHSALINDLARAGMEVIGGVRSMARYRTSDLSIREIAAELRVDALVESSVFWAGDSVGIEVRLLDGETERSWWTGSYVEETSDVLSLYRRVTAAISDEIHLALSPDAESPLPAVRRLNPQAYESYLRAQFHWNRLTPRDLETALAYLDRTLEADPEYADAHAGIAWVRVAQQQIGVVPPDVATPLADAAAQRAMELDPRSPEAHYADASVGWATWDWPRAEAGYRTAIELNPRFALARGDFSHYLSVMQRPEEALAQIDSAVEADPLNIQLMGFRGVVLVFQSRYEDAIAQLDPVLDAAPDMLPALNGIRMAYEQLGNEESAVEVAEASLRAQGFDAIADTLLRAYPTVGYRPAVSRVADLVAGLARERFVAPMRVARWYGVAGRTEETLDWLERAVDAMDPNSPYIGVAPDFRALHGQPRFQAILRRVGVPGPGG